MYVIGDEDWGYDGFDNLTGVGYDSAATAIPKLIDGTLTAIVVDNAPASALAAANSTDIKLINVPLTGEEYAFCLPKGSEYKTALDEYFAEIKQNGTLQAIIDKYFGGEGTKVGYGVVTE